MPLTGLRSLNLRTVARLEDNGRYKRWVLFTALAGMFATTFPITVLTVAIPSMSEEFGVSQGTLAWVITLPILLSALALPVLGKMGDLYGHRRVFLIGFIGAAITTALAATAASAALLIFWRTLTAITGAATQPSSLALINAEYPPEERSKAMGWWAMVAAGAPVIGLLSGGPLIDAFGWQVLFLIQAVLMIVPILAAVIVLRESPLIPARFDVLGSLTLIFGVGGAMLALSQGPDWGLTHPATLLALVVSVLGIVLFVAVERRAEAPLLPLEFLRRRDFSASVSASLFTSSAYMGAYFIATLMMINEFGFDATAAVPYLAVRPLVFAAASPVGGRLASRFGLRPTAVLGDGTMAVGIGLLAVGAGIESLPVVMVGFVLQGMGHGFVRPALSTALANSVDTASLGIAAASERLMGQIGVSLGITLLTVVYADNAVPSSFALAFGVGAAMAVIATFLTGLLRRGRVGVGVDSAEHEH